MKKTWISVMCIGISIMLGGCSVVKHDLARTGEELVRRLAEASNQNVPGDAGNNMKTEPDALCEPVFAEEYEAWDMAAGYAFEGDVFIPDWNTEEYKYVGENGWMTPAGQPFSTFAADVDTASYANVRRMLLEGRQVPADAVRIEEMINYFDYDYPAPKGGENFSVSARIAPCPWNKDTKLLRIGLKAREEEAGQKAPSNLVFLIDVSGSMDEYNKLPLVQRAFRLLINELGEEDTVSIVTYASSDTVVLDGASGSEKTLICDAVEDLSANGGTNGSQGIITAYELAQKHFIEGGINRVLLATDGDLNIGMTDEGSLTRLIEEEAKSGVFLSVLGFGEGNISDVNMEALSDHGNGNYSYIDNITEARKVLLNEAGGTLVTVAKDVKLQVEFNPRKVNGYRLIGYENRTMSAEDFSDDEKDGGELGSGHTVTALYEIIPVGSAMELDGPQRKYGSGEKEPLSDPSDSEWATVGIRHKQPDGDVSSLTEFVIGDEDVFDEMDDDMSWAAGVAQAGMILSESEYAGTTDITEVRDRLDDLTGNDEFREEFVYLLGRIGR